MADKSIFGTQGPSNPDLDRSYFDLSYGSNLTARFGRIYPILCKEALAGGTYKIKPSFSFDLMPMVFPIQTNIRCHMSFFKVPFRILWKNFKDFYAHVGDHEMPYIKRPTGWVKTGSLADYLTIPTFFEKEFTALDVLKTYHGFSNFGSRSILNDDGTTTTSSDSYDDLYQRGYTNVVLDNNGAIPLGEYHTMPFFSRFETITGNGYGFRTQHFPDGVYWSPDPTEQFVILDFYSDKAIDVTDPSYLGQSLHFAMSVNSKVVATTTRVITSSGTIASLVENEDDAYWIADTLNTEVQIGSTTTYKSQIAIWVGDIARFIEDSAYTLSNSVNLYINWSNTDAAILGNANVFLRDSRDIESLHELASPYNDTKGEPVVEIQNALHGIQPYIVYFNKNAHPSDDGVTPFDSILGNKPSAPINALSFRAYEMIYNCHFRNEYVDPFIKNGVETYNEFLTNDGDGADTTTPVDFFNAPYEADLFTTCVRNPQFGNAPLVGVTTNDMDQTFTLHMKSTASSNVYVSSSPDGTNHVSVGKIPSTTGVGTADFTVSYDHDGNAMALTAYPADANQQTLDRVRDLVSWGISVNDLRNASALQRFLERRQKAGAQYKNVVKEFFGTNAPVGDEFPEYLGGLTRSVMVNKIQNVSSQGSRPLGDFAGVGNISSGDSDTIEVFCNEPSLIMGLMYFTVTPTYSQQLPKFHLKSHQLDYYNPQFANIGLQPVYAYQINPLGAYQLDQTDPRPDGISHLFDVFGYNRPWSEYVSSQDEVHGLFRTPAMNKFVLQRVFSGVPELGHDFLTINSADLTDVFSSTINSDKILGLVYFNIDSYLPIPRFAIPKIL